MVIRAAKERGLPVTCEVSPHHLFLTQRDVPRIGEYRSVVKPPIVEEEDRQALWDNMEFIDCFATDHGEELLALIYHIKVIVLEIIQMSKKFFVHRM